MTRPPRVVLDTNVLISAVLYDGNEARILDQIMEGNIVMLASVDTLAEFLEVLSRPKFGLSSQTVLNVFQGIVWHSELISPVEEKKSMRSRDPDDQKFLDCARGGRADYLVTGDSDLLSAGRIGPARIRRPRAFLIEHSGH